MTKDDQPHGLVRPYVLSTGDSPHGRSMPRDAGEHRSRGDGSPPDWPHDARSRPSIQAPPPEVRPTGTHRPSARGRLLARPWLAGIGAGVAALAIIGGLALFMSRPPAKLLANAPASAHKAIRGSHPMGTHSKARHSPASTRTHPTPSPTSTLSPTTSPSASASPKPTSTTTASPKPAPVRVSYAVVRQHPHNFQAQFTIVNDGNTPVKGWELVVVLRGDRVQAVWDGVFHTDGDDLYIDPAGSQKTIAPGATVTEDFDAHGSTTTLTSCSFNGTAC